MTPKPDEEPVCDHDWITAANGLRGLKVEVCAVGDCGRVRLELEVPVHGRYYPKIVVVELEGESL